MAVRLKFNSKAFRQLLTDPKVQADLLERAQAVAEAAGEGVEVLPVETPRRRAHVVVATQTDEAAKDNAEQNTLIRAIDAGR